MCVCGVSVCRFMSAYCCGFVNFYLYIVRKFLSVYLLQWIENTNTLKKKIYPTTRHKQSFQVCMNMLLPCAFWKQKILTYFILKSEYSCLRYTLWCAYAPQQTQSQHVVRCRLGTAESISSVTRLVAQVYNSLTSYNFYCWIIKFPVHISSVLHSFAGHSVHFYTVYVMVVDKFCIFIIKVRRVKRYS